MFFLHNEWVPSVGQFWAWGKREADEKSTIFSGVLTLLDYQLAMHGWVTSIHI